MNAEELKRLIFAEDTSPALQTVAVLDAGRWPGLLSELGNIELPWAPLHQCASNEGLYEVIPYGVLLSPASSFTDRVLQQYGSRNTIFVKILSETENSRVSLTDFTKHFYGLPQVLLAPELQNAWMRIYDPEIFVDFWNVANDEQKHRLTGCIVHSILAEDYLNGGLLEIKCSGSAPSGFASYNTSKKMIIYEIQQESLAEAFTSRFFKRLELRIIKMFYADSNAKDLTFLPAVISVSADAAEEFGLVEPKQMETYICLDAAQNWRLLECDPARKILENVTYLPASRLALLVELFEPGEKTGSRKNI